MVLDIDPDHGGDESLGNMENQFGQLPDTWTVWTGGGGCHFFFRMPDHDIRNTASKIAPGIDVRGNGGYVVAPPSLHINGKYRWHEEWRPGKIELADVPEWMLNKMIRRGVTGSTTTQPIPRKLSKGTRNVELASAAGTMRRRGFCEEAIFAALQVENDYRCDPPLPLDEVRRIAKSIGRYTPDTTTVLTVRNA
jgi:hypothetical protein